MRNLVWMALALAAGCGGGGSNGDGGADGGAGRDAAASPDLALGGMVFKYRSDHITLPPDSKTYATDLNGDGRTDNKLGDIVGVLKGQNIDLQMQEDVSIAAGNGIELFAFSTMDPALLADPNARVAVYVAQPAGGVPDGGGGNFAVDKKVPAGVPSGALTMGSFQSADPLTLTMPPTVYLTIPLYTDTAVLPVQGARVAFTPTPTALMSGQLNGGVKKSDIDTLLIPALAKTFDQIAHKMPCDSNCMQVLMQFDTGDGAGNSCMNPDGTTSAPKDGSIGVCEVSGNVLVQALLAPDVQLFDGSGNWAPSKANKMPDCLSLGVAFTGVEAKFTE